MFAKLLVLCALAAVALSREYPAGVHPAICPDYPYCAPDTLAHFTPGGQPIPQWAYPGAGAAAEPARAAARYPAGLPPALCPNYPYCW